MNYVGHRGGMEAIVEDLIDLDIGLHVHVKNESFFYTFYKSSPGDYSCWFEVLDNYDGKKYTFYSFNKGHEQEMYNLSSNTLKGWGDLCNDDTTQFWFD